MIITVKIKVPDGQACYYESGHVCSWSMKHAGSGQKWCRVFDDARLANGLKCPECQEACKNGS